MENLVEAINTQTNNVEAVNKINNKLFNFLTGVELGCNWVEIKIKKC